MSGFDFNASYYLQQYSDVAVAVSQGLFASAEQHFIMYGAKELRNPNATFNSEYYLSHNPDVAEAVANGGIYSAWTHFQAFGAAEGRAQSAAFEAFDATAYLAANPDVQAAVTAGTIPSALFHYVQFGMDEGRSGSGVSGVGDTVGETFALTTGVDILAGTSNDDTFVGTASATTPTMNLGDSIDGGAGNDTLQIVSDLAGAIPAVKTTSVETYTITNSAAGSLAVNGLSTGLSSVLFSGGANTTFTLSGIGTGVGVGLTNEAGQITLTYDSVTGTADAASIALNGAKSTASVAAAGIETFNVSSTGAASTLAALTGAQGATLNITGDQDLTITAALANTFTTIAAGDATGKINLGLTAGGNATITTGSADDRVNMAGGLNANDTIDLGDGTDTIAVSDADLSGAGIIAGLKAVKNAEIVETTATAAVTIDGNALDAVTNTFKVSGAMAAAATGAAISVDTNNLENTDIIQISADRAGTAVAAAADNSGNTGADGVELSVLVDNGANVATLQLLGGVDIVGAAGGESNAGVANGGTGGVGVDAVTIETLNIVSTGTTANTISGGAGGASLGGAAGSAGASVAVNTNGSIVVTGDQDLNLGTISGTNATVDANAFTGKLTVVGEAGANTIIGGSAVDTITGGTGTDTLTGNGGADIFVFNVATDSEASATGLDADVITDYSADVLRIGAANNVAGASAAGTTATSNVEVDANGLVTFAAADDTLAEKLVALAADDTDIGSNEVVIFHDSGNTYIYGAGADTTQAADDFLIKLAGVTLTTLTESTATAGDFTVA